MGEKECNEMTQRESLHGFVTHFRVHRSGFALYMIYSLAEGVAVKTPKVTSGPIYLFSFPSLIR